MPYARDIVREQLLGHEGERLKPYRCTAGKLTIGVGRNIEDRGISKEESRYLLANDIVAVENQCWEKFQWFRGEHLNDARKAAVMNMVFNMGIEGFSKFRKTIAHLEAGRWAEAADEAMDSKWSKDVGRRAVEVTTAIREG